MEDMRQASKPIQANLLFLPKGEFLSAVSNSSSVRLS